MIDRIDPDRHLQSFRRNHGLRAGHLPPLLDLLQRGSSSVQEQ
jgi:hypothetical protein